MGDVRSGNPDRLEELADRLCSVDEAGAYGALVNIFDRARNLEVSNEVARLSPLMTWLYDIADQSRDRAALLRGETPSPSWGLGQPSMADIEAYQELLETDPDDPFDVVGQANLDEVLELARKGELSEEEMEQMRSLLGAFSTDPAFAAALVDELGVEEFLALSRRVMDDDSEEAASLSEELGNVLTAAFWAPGEPGTPEHDEWQQTPQGQAYEERLRALQDAGEANLAAAAQLVEGLINADDLSFTQLTALNEFLLNNNSAENGGNFDRALMDVIGPDGLVDLAVRLPELAHGGADSELREGYATLQENIANSLALATDVEKGSAEEEWYDEFMAEFREAGRAEHEVSFSDESDPRGIVNVRGYQMLVNLMEAGRGYSSDFLCDVADDIREVESDGTHVWPLGPVDAYLYEHGRPADRLARDPLDGVLGIMGRQPAVARDYLSDEENLDHLIDRDYLPAFGATLHDPRFEYGGFGDALEAATTGRPAGSGEAKEFNRTEEGDEIMRHLVDRFSEDEGALIADNGSFVDLRPQLGIMTSAFMEDIYYTLGLQADLLHAPEGEEPDLFQGRDGGQRLPLDWFLSQVARDPDGYAALSAAQQTFTSVAIEAAMNEHVSSGVDVGTQVENAIVPGARLAGILADARASATFDARIAGAEEFNDRLGIAEKVSGLVLAEGVDVLTERLPVGGGVISWTVEDLHGRLFGALKRDVSDDAYADADAESITAQEEFVRSTREAIRMAGENYEPRLPGEDPAQTLEDLQNSVGAVTGDNWNVYYHWTAPPPPPSGSEEEEE